MRIGLVTSSYPISPDDTVNAGVFVRDLAKELMMMGNEVHIITPRKYGVTMTDPEITLHFIRWWGGEKDLASISIHNWLTLVRFVTLVVAGVWQTIYLTRSLHLDAIMAMWAIPSGLFAMCSWKIWKTPYGVWTLGSDIWARHKYPFGDTIVRHILRNASFCFADGVELARVTSELAGQECKFVPSARVLNATLPPVQLGHNVPHFLYIGRYEYNKGPDVLIDAMHILLERNVSACLHMFGTGSMEDSLRDRVSGNSPNILVGGVATPEICVSYMQACDWLIIPSRIESIPLIFSDALQMKLPVIATDVGDLGEVVQQYQVGRVVPAGDAIALADMLEWVIKERNASQEFFFEQALKKFDIRQSANHCVQALMCATEKVK